MKQFLKIAKMQTCSDFKLTVIVPAVVTGELVTVNIDGIDKSTLVTVPP